MFDKLFEVEKRYMQLQNSLMYAYETLDRPKTAHSHGEHGAVTGTWQPFMDVFEDVAAVDGEDRSHHQRSREALVAEPLAAQQRPRDQQRREDQGDDAAGAHTVASLTTS